MAGVLCPCTVAVHFPLDVFQSCGVSDVFPDLVKCLDLPNVTGIQFLPNGVVRITFKESAQCDAVFASGISFRGVALRLTPVDARMRLVYVRDLPVEVPDDGLVAFLRPFGVVHSVTQQTYPAGPGEAAILSGTRVVKVSLSKDLPASARVSGFDVRFWYRGQPRACPICRQSGHRVKDCPFNGKCRKCSQPGHVARECPSRQSSVDPAPGVSEEEVGDPDYVPSDASESGPCSGDEEVLRSPPPSPGRRRAPPTVESPVPGMPEPASAGPPPAAPAVPVPASGKKKPCVAPPSTTSPVDSTPESASAVPVFGGTPEPASAAKSSVPASGKKKPRVAPPSTKSPVQPPFWVTSRRPQMAVSTTDLMGEAIRFEFGSLTRSLLRDSSTFEIDRFYKYRDRLVARPYLVPRDVPPLSLRAGVPLKFPKSSK